MTKNQQTQPYPELNHLPSAHQLKDEVWLMLWSKQIPSKVVGIHFTLSKVRYDLELFGDNGDTMLVHDIDSAYISKKI